MSVYRCVCVYRYVNIHCFICIYTCPCVHRYIPSPTLLTVFPIHSVHHYHYSLGHSNHNLETERSRFLAENDDDVQCMLNFYRKCGLSMKKSLACAEESICLDANSPRKLFKYVHEVIGFSLLNIGMWLYYSC